MPDRVTVTGSAPQRLGAVTLIEHQTREALIAGEIEHRLCRRQPLDGQPLEAKVDALVSKGQLDLDRQASALPCQQLAQRGNQRDQRGHQHRAFVQINQLVRAAFVEPQHHPAPVALRLEAGAAAAARRGEVHWRDPRCRQADELCAMDHPVGDEPGQAFLVGLLQLAPAAGAEMAARRRDMMRAGLHAAVGRDEVPRHRAGHVPARRGDPVSLGGNTDNLFGGNAHRQAA